MELYQSKGIIEQNTDIDVFGFATELGQVLINITPALKGPNLDILTELYDENGLFVLSDNPSLELASGIDTTLNQGIYYLVIKGTENINASDYGSMGSYSISATLPVSGSNLPPVAVASPILTSGMAPLTVSFSGSGSSDPDGYIVGYSWDFKDNNNHGSGENTSYTYTTGGIYNVELTVIDDKGATDLSIVTVEVTQPLIADFTADKTSGPVPLNVQFTDKSTGVATGWLWDFGDGYTSTTEQNPLHAYIAAGTYTVSLTVNNGEEINTKTMANYIVVAEQPTAAFSVAPTTGPAPLTVQFTDESTGVITNWNWKIERYHEKRNRWINVTDLTEQKPICGIGKSKFI